MKKEILQALDRLRDELIRHSDLQIAPSLSIRVVLDEVYEKVNSLSRSGRVNRLMAIEALEDALEFWEADNHDFVKVNIEDALVELSKEEERPEPVAWMSDNGTIVSAKMRELGMNDHGKEIHHIPLYT